MREKWSGEKWCSGARTSCCSSLHASFIRGHYGVRIVLDPALVRRFKPNVVVTLVDDVYDMWWRTEERASGEAWRGRPTLEQLLTARRVEQAVGTQIAHLTEPPVPHYLLSVHHSCETLFRLVYRKPLIVYLSFPISRPRELEQGGDQTGIEEINEFLVAVYARQAPDNDLVFLNPLTIDERPLIDRALPDKANRTIAEDRDGQHEYEGLLFKRERYRWALPDVCNENALSPAPPELQKRVPPNLEQVQQAAGLIKTDVGWRDYSLVAQAKRLAVFNPVFRNADDIARGVQGEIETALMTPGRTVFCYQSREYDPNGKFKTWRGRAGSTGPSGMKQRLIMCSSVEDLLDRVTRR